MRPFKKWFWFSCAFELGLLLLAFVLSVFTGQAVFADFHWDWQDGLLGLAASIPPFLLFVRSLRSAWPPLVEIRQTLESSLGRLFRNFSLAELAVISLLAGLCEEVLFRSIVQNDIAHLFGPAAGLLVSAVLFGLAHSVTKLYALLTMAAGLYVGLLWMFAGNLLTPIVTHAVYDFLALAYFLRRSAHPA